MFTPISWVKPAGYALAFVAGVGAMWLYHSAVVSGINESVALERQKAAEQAQTVSAKAQREVSKIEQYHYEKLQSGLASVPEPVRVFVKAKCPAVSAAGNPGVDSGVGKPELDDQGRRTLRELRQGIVRVEARLSACQAILKSPR